MMQLETITTPAILTPARPIVDASPHSREELRDAPRHPEHLIRLVLVQRERLHASIARHQHLWWLVGSLVLGSVLYALPFGAVLGVVASFAGARLRFSEVQELSFALFRDASVMLASLSPVGLFLALTIRPPTARGLGDYPLFLGFNVLLIAVSGTTALWRQTRGLQQKAGLSRKRGNLVVLGWLALSASCHRRRW